MERKTGDLEKQLNESKRQQFELKQQVTESARPAEESERLRLESERHAQESERLRLESERHAQESDKNFQILSLYLKQNGMDEDTINKLLNSQKVEENKKVI